MKKYLYKYSLYICLFFAPYLALMGQQVRFDRMGMQDGLSQSSSQCLLQDSNGRIWIGTEDGLNLYNGYQCKIYSHDALDSNSLSHNIITNIIEEDTAVFWVGTLNGINKLDTRTHRIERFYNEGGASANKNYFTIMQRDPKQQSLLWIGTHEGVWTFDTKKRIFEAFKPEEFSHLRVLSISHTPDGLLWIGSRAKGIYAWDRVNNRVAYAFGATAFGKNQAAGLFVHKLANGKIWIGTNAGLFELMPNGKLEEVKGFEGLAVSVLHEREDGIWVGTHQGLCQIQGDKHIWYYHNPAEIHSLSNNRIASMMTDNAGLLWIGTYFDGVNRYNPDVHQIAHYTDQPSAMFSLKNKVIRAVVKDSTDRVWIGTNQGISCFDRKAEKTYHYGLESGLQELIVRALHIDSSGRLWAGTGGGNGYLHYWNERLKRFVKVDASLGYKNAPPRNDIYAIGSSKNGTLWVGMQGEGLYRLPPNSKTFLSYKYNPENPASICNDFINAILEDKHQRIWLATRGGLACLVNPNEEQAVFKNYLKEDGVKSSLPHGYVKSLYEDSEGRLWMGMAGTGLVLMEDSSGVFKQFTQSHGLPNNMIYAILPDKEGMLWLSTNLGIAQFDRERQRVVKVLNTPDGLQGHEYNTGAYHKGYDGELFFGGINGLNAFYPSQLALNHTPAKPWISSLQVFNKPVPIGEEGNGVLTQDIAYTKEVYLDYTHQVFTLEAIALHYAASKDNQVAYRMVGLNEEWQAISSERRFITYTTLPPDTYVFEMKAGNSDGIWGQETRRLVIHIAPPIWKTWWFIASAITMGMLAILLLYRWRVADLKKQQQVLERQVIERTATLELQKQQINTKREEIIVQNEELRQQQDEILAQRDFIEEKNRLLTRSNEDLAYANEQVMLQKDMVEASLRNLEHLSKIGRDVTSSLQIADITRTVYEHVNMLMDASSFGIGLYNAASEQIAFHSFIEQGEELPAFSNPLKPDKYLSAHCFVFRKEIIIQQRLVKSSLKYIKEPLEIKNAGQVPNSVIYLPLLSEGRAVGVITVQSLFEKAYAEYEINMLRNIAIYVAIALDNAYAYDVIRQNNKNIKDSIEYARNIQQAVLPDASSIKALVNEYFIIYQPKDIVSGDLYWFSKPEKDVKEYAFVLMDCTGHGVPGAFMSLIGNTLLSEIVNEMGIHSPVKTLRLLEQNIRGALRQDISNNNDGMDISICFVKNLDDDKVLLRFAGAKQSCYYINEQGKIAFLKGARRSLGGKNYTNSPIPFDEHEVIIPKGRCVYMFTDGFIDQNGRTQRRYGSKRLLELLQTHAHLPMHRQKEEVLRAYNDYKGNADQRDDITLIGIRV